MSSNTNFATWNGVVKPAYTDFEHGNTKSDGNTGTDAAGANSSIGVSSGKWYMEMYLTVNTTYPTLGLSPGASAGDNRPYNQNSGYLNIVRYTPGGSSGSRLADNSSIFTPASFGSVTLTQTNVDSAATGDIIGFALDVDNRKLWISKNGTFMNSGNPASGSNEQISWTTNPQDIFFQCQTYTGGRAVHANFGQDSSFANNKTSGSAAATDSNGFGDFYYTPPTGFLALCSANLPVSDDINPAETDDDYPGKQFTAVTYTGNGSTQSINIGFQPDLLWFKNRGTANSPVTFDSTRGTTKTLNSDKTNTESTGAYTNLDSFTSTGFDLDGGGTGDVNQSSANLIAWCWRANGGTTSSNSEGDITSTVQANQKAGFSIVTYTGDLTSSGNRTVGHGLSAAPEFIVRKGRNVAERWAVSHIGLTSFNYMLELNGYGAQVDKSGNGSMSAPTTTVFSNNYTDGYAVNGTNYIAYCWHSVDGYSKFGKYEGNANADGIFVYTGFRPKMLFVKDIDRGENWQTFDTARNTFNPVDKGLMWNDGAAESTGSGSGFDVDFLSNGFKMRCTHDNLNGSSTYIYGAWGDVPTKFNNTF